MSHNCCNRTNVSPVELTTVTPDLLARLYEAREACIAIGVNPNARTLCGDCRQKLMGRHRALGKKAVISRQNMGALMGKTMGAERARWKRDEV